MSFTWPDSGDAEVEVPRPMTRRERARLDARSCEHDDAQAKAREDMYRMAEEQPYWERETHSPSMSREWDKGRYEPEREQVDDTEPAVVKDNDEEEEGDEADS